MLLQFEVPDDSLRRGQARRDLRKPCLGIYEWCDVMPWVGECCCASGVVSCMCRQAMGFAPLPHGVET